jgi:hypothetical protein
MQEITNPFALVNLIDDAFGLFLFISISREVCGVLDSFIFKKHEKKVHNMLPLMLDPRFKCLHLISSFVDQEEGISIVNEYDR